MVGHGTRGSTPKRIVSGHGLRAEELTVDNRLVGAGSVVALRGRSGDRVKNAPSGSRYLEMLTVALGHIRSPPEAARIVSCGSRCYGGPEVEAVVRLAGNN